jgi:fructokinase
MPQRIIMGGGVLHQEHLFPHVRYEVRQLLNNYIQVSELHEQLDHYIVPPALGDQAGVLGALALAHTVRSQ